MIENLLERLESDNSRLAKEAVLKEFSDSEAVKTLLIMAMDPFRRYKITLRENEIEGKGFRKIENSWKEFVIIADRLASSKGVCDSDKNTVVQWIEDHTPASAEFYRRVINKDLRCGVSGQTVKKIFGPGLIPEFSVQLAQKYDGTSGSWYASPKLDGNRAVAIRNDDGWVLYSRSGKEWKTVPHVNKELEKLDVLQITFCDGELYTKEFPFEKIQSALRSEKIRQPEAHLVKYFIFWMGDKKDFFFHQKPSTIDGIKLMEKAHGELSLEKIEIIPQYKVELTKEVADHYNKTFSDNGFEGVMFRHGEIGYDYKRSAYLLKYKSFFEEDFKVIGFEEGKGKNKGSLGAIVAEVRRKHTVETKEVSVGSGFTDEMRDKVWNNQDFYLGKMAEIKFQELSQYGIPRFPIFLKWKLDR